MNLTPEQMQAVNRGEAVRVTEDEQELVVLRADVYDRIKGMIYEDSPWTDKEKLAILREMGRKAGWDDPEWDIYEQFREPQ